MIEEEGHDRGVGWSKTMLLTLIIITRLTGA